MYLLPAHLDVRYTFAVLEEDESSTIRDSLRPGILALNLRPLMLLQATADSLPNTGTWVLGARSPQRQRPCSCR